MDDRCSIANGLNNRYSFKAIANTLEKDCTTISKEVKNISPFPSPDAPEGFITTASYAPTVSKGELCEECTYHRMKYRCRSCNQCNFNCDKYQPEVCFG